MLCVVVWTLHTFCIGEVSCIGYVSYVGHVVCGGLDPFEPVLSPLCPWKGQKCLHLKVRRGRRRGEDRRSLHGVHV